MARRRAAEKREVLPDAKYSDPVLTKFMNAVMNDGKKSVAERIVYGALDKMQARASRDPLEMFHAALDNVKPTLEVRSRRVGGATYQVPVEVPARRARTLAVRWLIEFARQRREKTMSERLAAELLDAHSEQGGAFKRKEDIYRMAQANKAFAHYRW
jgi:small subunit ribosomal protein S7